MIFSRKLSFLGFLLLCVLALFPGCKPDEGNPAPEFDREALLTRTADEIIIPRYEAYKSSIESLQAAATAFTTAPDYQGLVALKEQWREALLSWQRVAMFEFGPAADVAMQSSTNIYPTDPDQIESNIASNDYVLQAAANVDARGLPAIDYLIHGQSAEGLSALEAFTSGTNSSNRIAYLEALVDDLVANAEYIVSGWNGGYRDDFVNNTGTDVGSSLGLWLNAMNQSYEQVTRTQKLGLPTGALTFSQTPLPDHVEAYYEYTNSVAYLQSSIQAFQELYEGTGEDGSTGPGLDDYLVFLDAQYNGADLNQTILEQIDATQQAVNTLQNPLAEYVVSNQDDVLEVYTELQELVILWKVDMMSTLGVLITYQDNDGD